MGVQLVEQEPLQRRPGPKGWLAFQVKRVLRKSMRWYVEPALAEQRIVNDALLKTRPYGKPIVAAVNGDCVAGGLELLLSTDIRAAAPHARFGLPEVRWSGRPKIIRPADVWRTLVTLTVTSLPMCSRAPSTTIIVPSSR